jgi:hypothetical protein
MPASRRWRELRLRVLPVLTSALALVTVAILWHQVTLSPTWRAVGGRPGAPSLDPMGRLYSGDARNRIGHLGAHARRALAEQGTNYWWAAQDH